jgi:hypothetical protein
MGDSIGSTLSKNTATAGPRIEMNGRAYRVNCWHLWEEFYAQYFDPLVDIDICFPSRADLNLCLENEHDTMPGNDSQTKISGYVRLISGNSITTSRSSNDPQRLRYGKNMSQCVMDWTVSSESEPKPKPNIVRMVDVKPCGEIISITKACQVKPRSLVYSVGRSSGPQLGRIHPTMTWMNGEMNGTGRDTYEWSIEQLLTGEGTEAWTLGGTGIPGDSGASIIDAKENALCGVVWGCTTRKDKSRIAHFSAWSDVADDIRDRHPQHIYPTLPQNDTDPATQLSEPICDECSEERKEYLEEAAPVLNYIHDLGVKRATTGLGRSSTTSCHGILKLDIKEPNPDLSRSVSQSSTNTKLTKETDLTSLENGSLISIINDPTIGVNDSEVIDIQKPDANDGVKTQRSSATRPTARKSNLTVPEQKKSRGRSASRDSGYYSNNEVEVDVVTP